MVHSHEDFRHARTRLLRDVIDHRLVGTTLVDAGIVEAKSGQVDQIYRSGALATVFGFYDTFRLGPGCMQKYLTALYAVNEDGLAQMAQKAEQFLGERVVGKYNDLQKQLGSQ